MIHFQTIDVSLPEFLFDETCKQWLEDAINHYSKKTGEVFFLFCSDEHLFQMNVQFLKHDTYTDIITFNSSEVSEIVSGELYISIERVEENAGISGVSFKEEINRVMVHGILHLIGYNDKSEAERVEMRQQENFCLSLRL
ncbi:MAG: rRNA maturation RNase YbeY [Bacteroidales bacterium]|nr:rRNA maturation RNase YbeY [Bacteroidales bacterium]